MHTSAADGGGTYASRGTPSAARAPATPTDGLPAADFSAVVPAQRSLVGPRISVAVGADRDGAPTSVPCRAARIPGGDSGLSLGDHAVLTVLCTASRVAVAAWC